VHAYLSEVVSAAHRADLPAEGAVRREASRRGAYVRAPHVPRGLGRRLAAWENPWRAGRPVAACCPA
jgi:hypothetical protein